jgi:hypothetical protein
MEPTKINCYLCSNHKAKKSIGAFRNITIDCPECTVYQVTNKVIKVIFERDNGKEILNEHDKNKIIGYVKRYCEQEKKPPLITTDFIEEKTGKTVYPYYQ